MLGPFESQTNIQRIENVTPIEWHVYVLNAEAYKRAKDPQTAAFEPLAAARNHFARNSLLAYADCGSNLLWVFQLPKHCKSQAYKGLNVGLAEIVPHHPISQQDWGVLHASELDSTPRRPLQSPAGGIKPHIAALGSPVTDTFQSGSMSPMQDSPKLIKFGRHDIHDAFIHAVLESLSYRLVSKHPMIPLCFNTFVYDPDECHDSTPNDFLDDYDFDASPNLFDAQRRWNSITVGAEWLPDGTVITARWQGCNKYALFEEWSSTTAGETVLAPLGRKVPSGRLKLLPDFNAQSRSRLGRERQYRETEAVLEILADKGIKLKKPDKWLVCELGGDFLDRGLGISDASFIWPAELAFILVSQGPADQESIWTDPKLPEDPFTVIHDLDSTQMSDTMEEDKTNTPRHEIQSSPPDVFADILTDMLGPNSTVGVYPTPPETSRVQGSTVPREHPQFSAPTPATTSSGPGYGMDDSESQLDDLQSDEYPIIENNNDADDLFGDMSMDLGDETLNEDVFGFFDASKKREDDRLHLQPSSERPSISLTNESSLETNHRFKEKTVKFESHTSDSGQITADGKTPTEPETRSADSEVAADSQDGNNLPDPLKVIGPTPLSVRPGKVIDEKYKEGGLFGVSAPANGPTTHDPRTQLPSRPAIPIITVDNKNKVSWESSSSASITGDSDGYSSSSSDQEHDSDDDEMDGVVSSQTSASIAAGKENDTSDLSIIEIASQRMPLLNVTSGPRNDQFQRLSTILDLNKRQFMDLAQLVANQVSHWPTKSSCPTGSKRHRSCSKYGSGELRSSSGSNDLMELVDSFSGYGDDPVTLGDNFVSATKITISSCADLEPGMGMTSNLPSTTSKQEAWERSCTTFPRVNEPSSQLHMPNLVFSRDETKVVMSATALSLWAELGLGPKGGPKEVTAYCFVPDTEFWVRGASCFLETMAEVFPLLKLGEHSLGESLSPERNLPDGVVQVEPANSFQSYVQSLCRSLSLFGRCLSEDWITGPVAVYIVNPFDDVSVVPFFCAAFQKLQRLILSKHKRLGRNLTLKILPRSLFVQDFAFRLPSSCAMKSLAREIYDRCDQPEQTNNPEGTLTQLARPLPNSISFQLHSSLNRRPLDQPLVTHVAYSWRPGNVWISFAFCDDLGGRRWHGSYHLPWDKSQCQASKQKQGRSQNQDQSSSQGQAQASTPTASTPGPSSSSSSSSSSAPHTNIWQRFVGVARDVLASLAEISEDLMQGQQHIHHIYLVKDGPVTREEKYVWRSLMEKTAKPNGVASILGGGGGSSGSQGNTAGGSGSNSNSANSAVIMNWTISVLDCECPVELQTPPRGPDFLGNMYSGSGTNTADQIRPPWQQHQQNQQHQQDLPISTPGTPSLASPGMPGGGSTGLTGSFPRDTQLSEEEGGQQHWRGRGRLVTPELLAWFVPARGVLAQSYIGKLELLPTPAMPTNLSSSSTGLKSFAASGGGYLIMNSCSGGGIGGIGGGFGDDDEDTHFSGGGGGGGGGGGAGELGNRSSRRTKGQARDQGPSRDQGRCPRVLGLRIVAAKAPSLMDVRQLAEAYRALASIADVYGLDGTLPWHVAMARAARIGLGRCM